MKHKAAICAAIAVAGLAVMLPAPVAAQRQLPSYEAATIVRSMGLDPVGRPVRRGSSYVLHALDGYGQEVSVTVDARHGHILSVVPVAARYGARVPVYVPEAYYPGDDFRPGSIYAPMPAEPRVIYAPRQSSNVLRPPARVPTASAPAAKSTSKTASTPLPKPSPRAVAAAPAEATAAELTTGSIGDAAKQEEAPPAPAIPPVQSLE